MRRRPPRPSQARAEPGIHEATIEKLGTEGLGLAEIGGRRVLVPDTLPGERVSVLYRPGEPAARVLARLADSPERRPAPCPHFGVCGGCALQHLDAAEYAGLKQRQIADALARSGLGDVAIAPVLSSPPGSRRRANLTGRRTDTGAKLGYLKWHSRELVSIEACPILDPRLEATVPALARLIETAFSPGEAAGFALTALGAGIDLGVILERPPDMGRLEALAGFAEAQDLARLWWRGPKERAGTLLALRRNPAIRLGGAEIALPMGGFLQATQDGEAALKAAVLAALDGFDPVLDLFAGLGTFALPLAEAGHRVHAAERDPDALAALRAGAKAAQLLHVTGEARDLEARPLEPHELARYQAAVFDPPRAGARAQAERLATSNLRRLAGVSCNPATFARDAAILTAGGWRLERVQPVDQFLWSAHIELVGVFDR